VDVKGAFLHGKFENKEILSISSKLTDGDFDRFRECKRELKGIISSLAYLMQDPGEYSEYTVPGI